jgi:hypothetical protein
LKEKRLHTTTTTATYTLRRGRFKNKTLRNIKDNNTIKGDNKSCGTLERERKVKNIIELFFRVYKIVPVLIR